MNLELPIPFQPDMVKAVLADLKTMTRRLRGLQEINKNPDAWKFKEFREVDGRLVADFSPTTCDCGTMSVNCPYGKPGSLLWVKERHYSYGKWVKDGKTKGGQQSWSFKRTGKTYFDSTYPEGFKYFKSLAARLKEARGPEWESFYQRNSMFLEKKISRLWLRVTEIRVERLHDILYPSFKDDAILEGVKIFGPANMPGFAFQKLWISINGQESWDANPWVWVVKFEVVSKTGEGYGSVITFKKGVISVPLSSPQGQFMKGILDSKK